VYLPQVSLDAKEPRLNRPTFICLKNLSPNEPWSQGALNALIMKSTVLFKADISWIRPIFPANKNSLISADFPGELQS